MFTSGYSVSHKRTGIGFALTSNLVKDVAEKLRQSGVIERGWLGLQARRPNERTAKRLGLERGKGLVVFRVAAGGPAQTSGLAVGDAITTLNGRDVRDAVSFLWAVANEAPGSDVTLGIVRESGRSSVHVKLGRLADAPSAGTSTSPSDAAEDKSLDCLRYLPSVGTTVAVACEE
jgi:serine protease Do